MIRLPQQPAVLSDRADERTQGGREATRHVLIEATAQIMLDEGYAAATSRRVAARAGVKPPLVHYYFPSMDDLFVAVLRDKAEANLVRRCTPCGSSALPTTRQTVGGWQTVLRNRFLRARRPKKAVQLDIRWTSQMGIGHEA